MTAVSSWADSPKALATVIFFSKLNEFIFGYFDPTLKNKRDTFWGQISAQSSISVKTATLKSNIYSKLGTGTHQPFLRTDARKVFLLCGI